MGSVLKNKGNEIELNVIGDNNTAMEQENMKQDYELIPDPLDGGYGWVIVIAAAVQTCLCLRLDRSKYNNLGTRDKLVKKTKKQSIFKGNGM